jgi:carbamoyltransferase
VNGLLLKKGIFKNIFIQPATGDPGTSLGSALLYYHHELGRPRNFVMTSSFLGNGFTDNDYEAALNDFGLPYVKMDADYTRFAAKKLAEGKVVAWFQGRMEFGPRALGNRSILASPLVNNMKEVLNARVKFREAFRPFAGVVLEEDCGKYFDCSYPNPYMVLVYNIRPEYVGKMPAITHIDNSVRIQTVNQTENPALHQLLTAFKEETGYSVLVNTSFNIKNEPMVCSPADAARSFSSSGMDYMVIGSYVVAKKGDDQSLYDHKVTNKKND